VTLTTAPKETPEAPVVRVEAAPPPEVIFSAPTSDETDVAPKTTVRIQFSRDIDPATVKGHVVVRYAASGGAPIPFTTQYLPGNRVLQITFAAPLEPFSAVRVELGAGILGTDKQPLVPWTLNFQTGT
jgi:hypothetical protein